MSVTKKHVAPRCRVVIFSILLALLAIIAPGEALQAQQNDAALQQALAGLNVRSFKDKTAAVVALGELGDARAVVALEALTEGRLYGRKSDQTVVIADRDDRIYKLTDPVSGAALGEARQPRYQEDRRKQQAPRDYPGSPRATGAFEFGPWSASCGC